MKNNKVFNGMIWLVMGIVTPILVFFFIVTGAYAYYTAQAKSLSGSLDVGIVSVNLADAEISNTSISSTVPVDVTQRILPGSEISFTGKVQNTGNVDCYSILSVKITEKENGNIFYSSYYTLAGSQIQKSGDKYTTEASELNSSSSISISINVQVPWNTGNTYIGKTLRASISALTIQKANINSTGYTNDKVAGTNILINNIGDVDSSLI